jgi:hypothetical protein
VCLPWLFEYQLCAFWLVDCFNVCRIAHDCTIPAVLQSTSLRLLYNLIETIFQRRADIRTSEMYRGLLSSVLECFVRKLGALRTQVSRIIK